MSMLIVVNFSFPATGSGLFRNFLSSLGRQNASSSRTAFESAPAAERYGRRVLVLVRLLGLSLSRGAIGDELGELVKVPWTLA